MRLVFCGTPEFAVPVLKAVIAAGHEVALVVTQPDRAAGRGMAMQLSPVKQAAIDLGIGIVQPDKLKNNEELRERLEAIAPDAILVVAYGRIIPDWMLALPRLGNINLHGSLLPKYRGAAPIQWAIAEGEPLTGVTTMLLEAGLDTGPMLLAKAIPIGPAETAVDLYLALAEVGAELMVETLAGLEAGTVVPQQQDHAFATLAPILKREDALIDFSKTAATIYNRWRGFQPWPGAFAMLRGKKLIVHGMRVANDDAAVALGKNLPSGTMVSISLPAAESRVFVSCADATVLELTEVQMEGKRRMTAAEFLHGYQVKSGERLGQ